MGSCVTQVRAPRLSQYPAKANYDLIKLIVVLILDSFPRKLKFASVTDFSLCKLPQESFIVWGLKTAREKKNVLWSFPHLTGLN